MKKSDKLKNNNDSVNFFIDGKLLEPGMILFCDKWHSHYETGEIYGSYIVITGNDKFGIHVLGQADKMTSHEYEPSKWFKF